MKRILTIALITGLTACKTSTSITTDRLNKFSNEELCRALGTYNDDGMVVLKIYDVLKKRPDTFDTERCYILERMTVQQKIDDSEAFKKRIINEIHQHINTFQDQDLIRKIEESRNNNEN